MRLSLLVLASVAVLQAPAQAQFVGRPDSGFEPTPDPFLGDGRVPGPAAGRELRDTRRRIDRARESGALTRREARALKREARRIEAAAVRYGRDGLSDSERRELEVRTRVLREQAARASKSGG